MRARKPPDRIKLDTGHFTDEAKAWFYSEVRIYGRNPFKVGEQLGASRSAVRSWLDPISKQWSDGENLTPNQIAERMYNQHLHNEGGTSEDLSASRSDIPILAEIPEPITKYQDLSDVAKQAHDELGFWRKRYLARRHIPWQIEMCLIIMNWLKEAREREERVRGVLNTPPGGGKTTTVTHDFPGWMISRERNIRIALGSRTTPQATAYARRLRNTLERNTLLNVDFGRFKPETTEVWRQDEFIVDGVTGSEASLEFRLALAGFDYSDPATKARVATDEYGNPENPNDPLWEILKAIESTFVAGEKEATVKALSQQMGFLGGRFDLNLWDDLVDDKNSKLPEHRDQLAEWWEEYAVSRAEPGGIIALVGTRFGKYDLFRHCRDMTYTTDEDIEDLLMSKVTQGMDEDTIDAIREDLIKEIYDDSTKAEQAGADNLLTIESLEPDEDGKITPKRMKHKVYRYVKFPAHDDPKCAENGTLKSLKSRDHLDCVLDPRRFKWHDLLRAKESNPRKYALTYQQEDESTEDNLIQDVWLTGGVDENNITYPGCYNYGRRLLQLPPHLDEVNSQGYLPRLDTYSIATVDPSAVNYWSIQWWLWQETEDVDYLMNIMRARLSADSFLSFSKKTGEYHGIMDQWQTISEEMGYPIGLWIIEEVAAQRYLFQHTWVNEWMKERGTHIKGHESNPKKADSDFGPMTLRPRYRRGQVDLPYDQDDLRARVAINEFKQELTEWPDSPTDDMVDGHWFLEANRYTIPKSLKVERHRSTNPDRMKHPYGESMPPRMNDSREDPRKNPRHLRPGMGHLAARRSRRHPYED